MEDVPCEGGQERPRPAEDDREEVIRQRLDAYEKQTRPLIDYFRETGKRLYEIDASRETPDAVFRKIQISARITAQPT